jgi:ACS family glucarate transporter-like MFS transporter
MMFFCSVAYLLCPQFTNPILFVCMLSVMAVAVDFSNPSLWAFAQDVGGRNAGKVLGWGNMFGNIGAGLSPILMASIQQSYGWNVCFYVFATCFFLAGILAMLLNAEKKISE